MTCTVILGCGIHGLSAAYALAQLQGDGRSITVIDVANDACEGASGRPTAFLSGAEIYDDNLEELLHYSMAIHAQLAKDHQGVAEWQYDTVQNYNARAVDSEDSPREDEKLLRTPEGFSWLACGPPWEESQWTGPTDFCSIDPHALGKFLLDQVKSCGARALFNAEVTKVNRNPGCDVSSLVVRTGRGEKACEEEIACDRLLIAAGPWTASLFRSVYPNAKVDLPIYADTGSYSMLLQFSPQHLPEREWLNKSVVLRSNHEYSLQLMVRKDGLVHAATVPPVTLNLGSAAAGGEIERVGNDLRNLEEEIQSMLSVPSEVISRRACFSPITKTGLPIMSQVPSAWLGLGNDGLHRGERKSAVYVMGGHGYWGIAASLGSGKLMAQLMLGRETDVDITKFCLEAHCAGPEQRHQSAMSGVTAFGGMLIKPWWKACLSCLGSR